MANKKSFFESFNREFERALPSTNSYSEAFNKASNSFESKVGESPYSSLRSFQAQRSKRNKKG